MILLSDLICAGIFPAGPAVAPSPVTLTNDTHSLRQAIFAGFSGWRLRMKWLLPSLGGSHFTDRLSCFARHETRRNQGSLLPPIWR
jgi:hypothetical protein